MTLDLLPNRSGTYILLLELASAAALPIGRLGTFSFAAGWYAYVGSAFGPGGLRGRLAHHLAPVTRPHWHIDFLRSAAVLRRIAIQASDSVLEHRWAVALQSLPLASIPVPRFGASDCHCAAHLLHFPRLPDLVLPPFAAAQIVSVEP